MGREKSDKRIFSDHTKEWGIQVQKIKVGIGTHDELRDRALQIARGERRCQPDEPKVWFTSLESTAKVLSEPNRKLLGIIDEQHPASQGNREILPRANFGVLRPVAKPQPFRCDISSGHMTADSLEAVRLRSR